MRYPKKPDPPETKEEREARLYAGQKIHEKRRQGWAHFGSCGVDFGVTEPVEFLDELEQLADGLIDSHEWCAWWAPVDRPRLTLFCFFTKEPAKQPWSRRTADEVLVNLTFTVHDPAEFSREHAREVVTEMFDRMRHRYKLGELPPLPVTDGGPAEPPEFEEIVLTPEQQERMPRIWAEDERIYLRCPVCQEVSRGHVSSAGNRWFWKHVVANHPEYGWK